MNASRLRESLGPAVLSAVLLAASYPPLHPVVLPFVALVPLFWALDRAGNPVSAARCGAVFATVHFGLVCYWAPLALTEVSAFAALLFGAGLAIAGAVGGVTAALLYGVTRERPGVWPLAAGVLWAGFEWTLAALPCSLAFPWLGLAAALTGVPEWIGIAEFVGARGITLWIAAVNGLVLTILVADRGSVRRSLAILCFLLTGPIAVGYARARSYEPDVSVRVAVMQTAISTAARRAAGGATEATLSSAERLIGELEPGSVSLVVWPEGALSAVAEADSSVDDPNPDDRTPDDRTPEEAALRRVQRLAREVGAPILFGVSREDPFVNSALLMEPGGLTDFRYDKHRLVPVAEGPQVASPAADLLSWDDRTFGVLICFESAFADAARFARTEGADVLVNITNDAWSGGGGDRRRTAAVWQHPAHTVLRAIETRSGVVRAANGGLSFFVTPLGHVYEGIPLGGEGLRAANVESSIEPTLFLRYGDWVGRTAGSALWMLALMWSVWWALWGRAGGSRRSSPLR